MFDKITTLRAAWVLPVTSPPIQNGEIVIAGNRIVEIRQAGKTATADTTDFGDAILLPGLVNVHTHLEYTLMRGLLEDIEFFPWIRELTARKVSLTPEDWLASASCGAAEALAGGVTTIGDCTDSGAAFYGARDLGLRGRIYQEVFGIDELQTIPNIISELDIKVNSLVRASNNSNLQIGISPHSPYTVRPDLMRALAEYARVRQLSVCIHAAESQAEVELLRMGTGPIAEMFQKRAIQWKVPAMSAPAYLDSLGILNERTLLVHGVQASATDCGMLIERQVAWAHCPKSNAKLGNGVCPLHLLREEERDGNPTPREATRMGTTRHPTPDTRHPTPKIGLGSDSVASNNTMDMFEEMRFAVLMQRGIRRRIDSLGAREAVEIATIGGAAAMGMERDIGSIEPGKLADLCAVSMDNLHSQPAYDPYSALVYAARASDVLWTMIDGIVRYDAREFQQINRRFPGVELASIRERLRLAADKMRQWRPSQ